MCPKLRKLQIFLQIVRKNYWYKYIFFLFLFEGCSKCWKSFPRSGGFGSKPDFSGFNVEEYSQRFDMAHKLRALEVKNADSKANCVALEKKYGLRYSELNWLPYYNPVQMHVVDPMHNLLLGTAS